jgi:hypothetical protein
MRGRRALVKRKNRGRNRRNRHETCTISVFDATAAVAETEWEPHVAAIIQVERNSRPFSIFLDEDHAGRFEGGASSIQVEFLRQANAPFKNCDGNFANAYLRCQLIRDQPSSRRAALTCPRVRGA